MEGKGKGKRCLWWSGYQLVGVGMCGCCRRVVQRRRERFVIEDRCGGPGGGGGGVRGLPPVLWVKVRPKAHAAVAPARIARVPLRPAVGSAKGSTGLRVANHFECGTWTAFSVRSAEKIALPGTSMRVQLKKGNAQDDVLDKLDPRPPLHPKSCLQLISGE
jgi:hypothetical protein